MAPLVIGAHTLAHGVMLAPMAGVADTAFRVACRARGAEYTVSEMISAKALCFEQKARASAPAKTAELANIIEEESPMAIQLFGREPKFMAEAARMIESGEYRGASRAMPPAAIDINMGCPVPKVVGNGEGSALMREPALAAEIVREIKKAVKLPVTVKIRAGFTNDNKNAPEMARMLEEAGADLICVHGRTRQQFYQLYFMRQAACDSRPCRRGGGLSLRRIGDTLHKLGRRGGFDYYFFIHRHFRPRKHGRQAL